LALGGSTTPPGLSYVPIDALETLEIEPRAEYLLPSVDNNPGLPPSALHPSEWFSKEVSPLTSLTSTTNSIDSEICGKELEDNTIQLRSRSLNKRSAVQTLSKRPQKSVRTKKPKTQVIELPPSQPVKLQPVDETKPFPEFSHWPEKCKVRREKRRVRIIG
jgi:hypothetical protein